MRVAEGFCPTCYRGRVMQQCVKCEDHGRVCETDREKPYPHYVISERSAEECPGPGMPCNCEAGARLVAALDAKYRDRALAHIGLSFGRSRSIARVVARGLPSPSRMIFTAPVPLVPGISNSPQLRPRVSGLSGLQLKAARSHNGRCPRRHPQRQYVGRWSDGMLRSA